MNMLFGEESAINNAQNVKSQHDKSMEIEKIKTAFSQVKIKQGRRSVKNETVAPSTVTALEQKLNVGDDVVTIEVNESGNYAITFENTGNEYELTASGLLVGEDYIAQNTEPEEPEIIAGIPIYTWLDLKNMGTGKTIYDLVTEKSYTYELGETYVLQNDILFYEDFTAIQNLIDSEQIEFIENGHTITMAEETDKSYFTFNGAIITGLSSLGLEKYNNGELTDLVLPAKNPSNATVTTIAEGAFSGKSNITSIYIPNGYTTININAFKDCTGITEVVVPGSIATMKYDSFRDCTGLYRVVFLGDTLPGGADKDNGIFWGCSNLKVVEFKGAIPRIRNGTVANTGIEKIIIPDTVTSIGQGVFENCTELVEIVIPNSVTLIEENAFYGCTSLASLTISNKTATIGKAAFSGCTELTLLEIPPSVTDIGENAFYGCTSLDTVKLSIGVTSIGKNSFNGCTGLAHASYTGTRAQWDSNVTKGIGNQKLYDLIQCSDEGEVNLRTNNIDIAYIEATGTQYIDTGYKGNQDTAVEVKFEFATKEEGFIYGGRKSMGEKFFGFTHYTAEKNYRFDYNGTKTQKTPIDTNTIYIAKQDKNLCYLNNTLVQTYTYASSGFTTPCNITICAVNTNGTIGGYAKAKIYYLKMWDNGTLIRDFVPVYNIHSGQAGLYDIVNSRFYASLGNNPFVSPYQE